MQLTTSDACYSDGDRYKPVTTAIKELPGDTAKIKTVLALGTGLGSIVRILTGKGLHPRYTLVEIDKVILGWALEYLEDCNAAIEPVCADAQLFMQQNEKKYDFIFVDVFINKVVPEFVGSAAFLQQCRASLVPGGHLALNYMVNDKKEWDGMVVAFSSVFPKHHIVSFGMNRLLVAE